MRLRLAKLAKKASRTFGGVDAVEVYWQALRWSYDLTGRAMFGSVPHHKEPTRDEANPEEGYRSSGLHHLFSACTVACCLHCLRSITPFGLLMPISYMHGVQGRWVLKGAVEMGRLWYKS